MMKITNAIQKNRTDLHEILAGKDSPQREVLDQGETVRSVQLIAFSVTCHVQPLAAEHADLGDLRPEKRHGKVVPAAQRDAAAVETGCHVVFQHDSFVVDDLIKTQAFIAGYRFFGLPPEFILMSYQPVFLEVVPVMMENGRCFAILNA